MGPLMVTPVGLGAFDDDDDVAPFLGALDVAGFAFFLLFEPLLVLVVVVADFAFDLDFDFGVREVLEEEEEDCSAHFCECFFSQPFR